MEMIWLLLLAVGRSLLLQKLLLQKLHQPPSQLQVMVIIVVVNVLICICKKENLLNNIQHIILENLLLD